MKEDPNSIYRVDKKGEYSIYYYQMNEYCKKNNIELTTKEIGSYSNMFLILNQIVNYKLNFDELLKVYDTFSDVLEGTRPDIALLNKEDRFKGLYRLLSGYELTKQLEDEEKKLLAFCIYYAVCIKTADDEGNFKWTLDEFTSVEKMRDLYNYYQTDFPDRFIIKEKNRNVNADNYGYDLNNPIELTSIRAIYNYLNDICLEDGTNIKYERIGSTINIDNEHIDMYQIYVDDEEKDILYFSGYCNNDSKDYPKGYRQRIRKGIIKEWGKGIPTYTEKDIMSAEEILDFGIQIIIQYALDNGYEIDSYNNRLSVYPNIILRKDKKVYGVLVKTGIAPQNPKMTMQNKFDMIKFERRLKAIPLFASVGIGSTDAERFDKSLALIGDGYYANFVGFENVSADDIPDIKTKEYKNYLLHKLGMAYMFCNFKEIKKFIAKECIWKSSFSKTEYSGIDEISKYYLEKLKTVKDSNTEIYYEIVTFDGNFSELNVKELHYNDEIINNAKVKLLQKGGENALLLEQKLNGETNGLIIDIEINDEGKIISIDLEDPYKFCIKTYKEME